jgi:hypothetical protein
LTIFGKVLFMEVQMIGIVFEVYDDWDYLWSIWLGLFLMYMMIGFVFNVYDDWDCS